jgi:hypothetical protein
MMLPSEHEAEPAQAVIAPGVTQVHRASPPRPPRVTAELSSAREEHAAYVQGRERLEHAGFLRVLVVLAVLALAASIAHAGLGRVFVHGWWRQW